ncbi:MAG: shikimate dehydrogenase family protein [bacterium]
MKRYGLIGKQLGHSWSQQWFEDLFAKEGLTNHSYRLFELPTLEGLRQWVQKENLLGFNVTVPYKQAILPQLDTLDPEAEAIGAVNCVTVEQGRLIGHNTDAPAFQQSLLRIKNEEFKTKNFSQAFILGTGGAAQAVAYALRQLDIPCRFVSRHPDQHPNSIGYGQLSSFHFPLSTFHLIINATPVGMYPDIDQSPLDLASHFSFLTSHFVYDLIYNPSPTLLMRQAARHGAHVKDGLEMLYLQAQLSWELFRNV